MATLMLADCSYTQELPPYDPDSRSQAKCEVVLPPSYSLVNFPMIVYSLKLCFSSARNRSANIHDQLDIRSVENNLPLYLVNKSYFDNITSTFTLANSCTNQPIIQATKDLRKSNHFVIQDGSLDIVLRSTSIFRTIYKFTWNNLTFRWSFDGDDLSCVLQSVDPRGRKIHRSVGGVELFNKHQTQGEKIFGRVWIFQNASSSGFVNTQFEPIFLITSALIMKQAGILKI